MSFKIFITSEKCNKVVKFFKVPWISLNFVFNKLNVLNPFLKINVSREQKYREAPVKI